MQVWTFWPKDTVSIGGADKYMYVPNLQRWSVECGVWSVECGVWSVECGVWSVVLWSVECGVWSVECGVRSVECGVWLVLWYQNTVVTYRYVKVYVLQSSHDVKGMILLNQRSSSTVVTSVDGHAAMPWPVMFPRTLSLGTF